MNESTLKDALILPFFWLFIFAFTSSVGYAFVPFKRQQGAMAGNLFTWFWYGTGIIIGFLQLWHLFFAVNIYSFVCLVPVGILGAARLMRSDLIRKINSLNPIAALFCLAILVFLITSSLDNTYVYDVRVYHFMSIKWLYSYPVIPGLTNLFIHLGYNESFFLFPAFLNNFWHAYKGVCATSGLFAFAICCEIVILNAKRVVAGKVNFLSAFQLLFLPLCVNVGVQNLSSPSPDYVINLLTFKLFSDLISCLEAKKINFQDIFLLMFYCLLGVIMKLSFIGIALGAVPVMVVLVVKFKLFNLKHILQSLLIFAVLIVPWLVNGFITSGYILFPLSRFAMPVDWRASIHDVRASADYTIGFSRVALHGQDAFNSAHGYQWVPVWSKRIIMSVGFTIPVLLFLGAMIFLKLKKLPLKGLKYIIAPIVIGVIFWFFTAPDLRFARFTFWALGLASFAYFLSTLKVKWQWPFSVVTAICTLLIMVKNWNPNIEPIGCLNKPATQVFTTRSGLKINVVAGKQDAWLTDDCPLPCSVFPDSGIMLRGKTITKGFKNSLGDRKTSPYGKW